MRGAEYLSAPVLQEIRSLLDDWLCVPAYRSKVSNDDFIPMTNRLRTTLLNRQKAVAGEYVFPGRFGDTKRFGTIVHWKPHLSGLA